MRMFSLLRTAYAKAKAAPARFPKLFLVLGLVALYGILRLSVVGELPPNAVIVERGWVYNSRTPVKWKVKDHGLWMEAKDDGGHGIDLIRLPFTGWYTHTSTPGLEFVSQ